MYLFRIQNHATIASQNRLEIVSNMQGVAGSPVAHLLFLANAFERYVFSNIAGAHLLYRHRAGCEGKSLHKKIGIHNEGSRKTCKLYRGTKMYMVQNL